MSNVSDAFVKYVKMHGWLSVTCLLFDNGLTINPHTQHGCACLSESAGLIFAASRLDSAYSENLESEFIIAPQNSAGFQQTIVCVGFETLFHFDAMQFTHARFYDMYGTEYPIPAIPTADQIESLVYDEETGLYAGTDTIEKLDGGKVSSIPLFPDQKNNDFYYGIRVDGCRAWLEKQKNFCNAVNTLFGLSDCI